MQRSQQPAQFAEGNHLAANIDRLRPLRHHRERRLVYLACADHRRMSTVQMQPWHRARKVTFNPHLSRDCLG